MVSIVELLLGSWGGFVEFGLRLLFASRGFGVDTVQSRRFALSREKY
jgi:hypothetical protein